MSEPTVEQGHPTIDEMLDRFSANISKAAKDAGDRILAAAGLHRWPNGNVSQKSWGEHVAERKRRAQKERRLRDPVIIMWGSYEDFEVEYERRYPRASLHFKLYMFQNGK